MADIKKVIKGLECCIKRNPDDKPRCNDCPYTENCLNRLKIDALALLKAQIRTIEQFEHEREQQMWNMPPIGGFHDD